MGGARIALSACEVQRVNEMTRSQGHRGITASILAVFFVGGGIYLDYYILANGLPRADGASHDAVIMVLTAWNGMMLNVCSYFFGNSANSDRKTEILANSSPAQTTTASTADATLTSTPTAAANP